MQVLDFIPLNIVTHPPEGDDGMANTRERLEDHDSRLNQVEVALKLKPEPKQPFLKEKYEWLINHRGTSLILAVILCTVSVSVTYWLNHRREWWNQDVDERLQVVLAGKDGVNETLHRVDQTVNRTEAKLQTLEPFIRDVIQHQFDSAAKLPIAMLQERLPAVQHLLATAKDQRFKADAKIVDTLTRKLNAANTSAGGFWPTAAEFISYRSLQTEQRIADGASNFPNCTDHRPTAPKIIGIEGNNFTLGRSLYENCRITFDSPLENEKINSLLQDFTSSITFRNCVVIYRGGEIKLIVSFKDHIVRFANLSHPSDPPVLGTLNVSSTLQFENCLFDFTFRGTPPIPGQELTRAILATGSPTIGFRVQKPATHY